MKKILFCSIVTFCFAIASKANTTNTIVSKKIISVRLKDQSSIKFSCCTGYFPTSVVLSHIKDGTLNAWTASIEAKVCASGDSNIA